MGQALAKKKAGKAARRPGRSRAQTVTLPVTLPQGNFGPEDEIPPEFRERIARAVFQRTFEKLDANEQKRVDKLVCRFCLPQWQGADIVPMHKGDWSFKRRLHRLDLMCRAKGRRRDGEISRRHRDAGVELYDRWERRQLTGEPAWCRPYVDGGRSGDMTLRMQREGEYQALVRVVPRHCLAVVRHVVLYQRPIRGDFTPDAERAEVWLKRLQEGLEALARELRV